MVGWCVFLCEILISSKIGRGNARIYACMHLADRQAREEEEEEEENACVIQGRGDHMATDSADMVIITIKKMVWLASGGSQKGFPEMIDIGSHPRNIAVKKNELR